MPKQISEIEYRSPEFMDLVEKVKKATSRAFIETGRPIPDVLPDIVATVAFVAVEDILDRLQETEIQ